MLFWKMVQMMKMIQKRTVDNDTCVRAPAIAACSQGGFVAPAVAPAVIWGSDFLTYRYLLMPKSLLKLENYFPTTDFNTSCQHKLQKMH